MNHTLEYPIRSGKFTHRIEITEQVYAAQTDFQRIDIMDTATFGRILLLDNHIQLSTLDEAAYHESLVQVPLLNIPNPKSALVIGGGDGGVIREILRHPGIERVTMVEIDEGVVKACRAHLPTLNAGAFDDPRLELIIGDAFPYVRETDKTFDLIVVDATDTYEDEEGELSESLFTKPFYEDCRRILSSHGFLVTQADNLLYCPYSLDEIEKAFGAVFPKVGSYWGLVPSFGGFSGYCWASHGVEIAEECPQNPIVIPTQYLNKVTYELGTKPLPFHVNEM